MTERAKASELFGVFDFGLDDAQEERARQLHAEAVVVDMLFQGPVGHRVYDDEMVKHLRTRFEEHGDIVRGFRDGMEFPLRMAADGRLDAVKEHWDASGVTCGNRQVELGDEVLRDASFAFAQFQFDRFDWLTKALRVDDVRRAKATGGHAGLVSSQVTTGPWRDLDALTIYHDFGLRMCQLTYNSMSKVGVGCTERVDGGLSQFGVDSVRVMNELGIIVDTGHVGRRTTLDACEVSDAPVVASHTTAAAVHPHARGKDDETIRAIAATGGVIGVVTVPFFLGAGPRVDVHAFLDHVEHIAEVGGVDSVGIGTDWPIQLPQWMQTTVLQPLFAETGFRPEHGLDATQPLIGFEDYRDFPNITRGLFARGWADEDIRKVLGENFLRVMGKVCG